jgi:hypothetical protein
MNTQAFFILVIPLLGLFAILRGGTWHWDPIGRGGPASLQTPFLHALWVGAFWLGWSASLLVGLLMILGAWPNTQ